MNWACEHPEGASHNSPADIYTKCVTSPVLERHLRHNGIIELHIEEGEINYFHILELAEQYFSVTSDEEVKYTEEQQRRMKNSSEYTSFNYNKRCASRCNNTTSTSRRRRITRSCPLGTNVKKQHNKQTSSTNSHNYYFNIEILRMSTTAGRTS